LVLKAGVLGEEVSRALLVRHAELGVVPQLRQLLVDLLAVRTRRNERMADLVLRKTMQGCQIVFDPNLPK
jgi:hypothetical protein